MDESDSTERSAFAQQHGLDFPCLAQFGERRSAQAEQPPAARVGESVPLLDPTFTDFDFWF